MTELRKRMIECLQLRGLSARTQESYVRAVRQLAEHYHKSPDLITEEELRQYFLFIKNVKHYSRSTATIAICGIKFFFERTLEKDWTTFNLVRPAPLTCEKCGEQHFDQGESAFTPHDDHCCHSCGSKLRSKGKFRKTIGNPICTTLDQLAKSAVREPQKHNSYLLTETL